MSQEIAVKSLTFAEVKQKRMWIGACSTNEQGEGGSPMRTTAAAVVAALAAGAAWAGPGDMDSTSGNEPALWVQEASKATPCTAKGGMCFKPGTSSTVL